MNRKGLAFKIILPVVLALTALLGVVIWGVSAYETQETQETNQTFADHVTALALGNPKAGDLVDTFGVSVSTAELHRSQRNLRLLSIVGGLALLVALAAIFFYRVRVSLLQPLGKLSAGASPR